MFLTVLWNYIVVVSPYLLFGILFASIIHNFLSMELIQKQLGGKSLKSIFKAALFGVPLPLCSCSVIPSAVTLRKAGASNGATSAFLISTPETGVDSIAVTYGLMGAPMAIIRPVVSFLTASIAGVMQHLFNNFEFKDEKVESSCCCKKTSCCSEGKIESKKTILESIGNTFKYAATGLLEDIALWLTIGLVLGAMIEFFIPVDFFSAVSGPFGRLVVLAIGIPFYICASASTPIAVSMIVKGMSPGTALILLLVGPATNISTFLVMQKYIGKKGIFINILVLAITSYIFSFIVDGLFYSFNWALPTEVGHHHGEHISLFAQICGVIFSMILIRALFVSEIIPRVKKLSVKS